MKKLFLLLFIAFSLFAVNKVYSQTNNPILEFCTGTWCQYCPCGHQIAQNIQNMRPNALILAYHGPLSSSDPYRVFNGNEILNYMAFSGYPQGVVGRQSGVLDRGTWQGWMNVTSSYEPGVSINVTKNYNSSTRQLQVTANVTALRTIDSTAKINFVITEDNLVYFQQGSSGCPGGSNYIHSWVVRNMVTGALGEELSTGTWTINTVKSKSWTTTLDAGWNDGKCNFAVFVNLSTSNLTSGSPVLQTFKNGVVAPVGVAESEVIPADYSLSQNYPNPFNPSTNIHFSLPKESNVSLKIFDLTGREVAAYMNNSSLKAGEYNVEVDASSWSSGIYFYTLQANDFTATKKMMLVK
ncbi:MAG: T9SS C-terminal target domain-containing protein [Ignavibacteriae bacterium]|nr:MAG: T9SS C-terminal target domain-containing protein [Ignavibacteriota bacterium]